MTIRLAIFATHPVQYHVPIWRILTSLPHLDVMVYYFSDFSIRGAKDPGFGVKVSWDVPLLEGYRSEFISRDTDISKVASLQLPYAKDLLIRERIDAIMIQGYMHPFERQVIRAAKSMGLKIIMRGEFADLRKRNFLKNILRYYYLKWFYSHVDAFCYIGDEARRHLLHLNVPEKKLFFSPYSVDTQLFTTQINKLNRFVVREDLGLTNEHFCFIFSGKLIPRKEPILLLDALSKIQQRDNIALIMLGDGPLREQIIERGKAVLGPRFLFRGFVNQSELGKYFLAADAFVLPSSRETWGLVVNEAMQFGLPVIVSDNVGCQSNLVSNHDTGQVFLSGNSDSLASALTLLAKSPETARRQGEKAKMHIKNFTSESSANGISEALNAVFPNVKSA